MPKTHLVVGPDEVDNEQFGALLHTLRDGVGLSRADAAKAIGISSEYLRLIERGKRTPAAGKMPHILSVYGQKGPCVLGARKVAVDSHVVEFTSRIQEARGRSTQPPNRSERIGQIVALLMLADDQTLTKLHQLLQGN